MEKVKLTWKQYRQAVSNKIAKTYGLGLDDLPDCDLEGRWIFDDDTHVVEKTLEEWRRLISEDAAYVLENDDTFSAFFPEGALFD